MDGDGGAGHAREQALPPLVERATSVQPARPAHRERAAPALHAVRARCAPVVAARRRDPRGTLRPSTGAGRFAPARRQARDRITDAALEVARGAALARERALSAVAVRAAVGQGPARRHRADHRAPHARRSSTTRSAVLDHPLDDDARRRATRSVHPGNAVVDFHNSAGWMQATVD